MPRGVKPTRDEVLAKVNQINTYIREGKGKTEARELVGMSGSSYYGALKRFGMTPEETTEPLVKQKRKRRTPAEIALSREGGMVTLQVPNDSDKVCMFIGSPRAVVEAAKEFMR